MSDTTVLPVLTTEQGEILNDIEAFVLFGLAAHRLIIQRNRVR